MGFPRMPLYTDNAILPNLFGVNIGWVFGLLLVAGMYIFMTKSKKGYEIAVLGESEKTAVYAGINVKNTILVAMLLSGGLCGLAGYIQASAVSYTLSTQVSGGVGFTAIIVAWLGSLSAPLILIVSILFAALVNGGAYIQTALGTPESTAQILQAMILFFVLGSEFFTKYKIVKKVSVMKKEEE
jgi:simple sugar transport system permease protein